MNTFFADYTKNISHGGTFIRTVRPLSLGTEFTFVLAPPGATPIELHGIVKWRVTDGEATTESPAGMGIEFLFANESQRRTVESAVEDMMNASLGPHLARKLLRGTEAN